MAEELLTQAHQQIEALTLVPGSKGIFEVQLDGRRLFSKEETGRFPEKGEILQLFLHATSRPAD